MCPKLLREMPSRQTSPKMGLLFQLFLVILNIESGAFAEDTSHPGFLESSLQELRRHCSESGAFASRIQRVANSGAISILEL